MKKAQWENWTNLILGLLLFIMPWIVTNEITTNTVTAMNWNAWIVGAVMAISAALALQNLKPWEEWVNMILGVWLVISPWVFGYVGNAAFVWGSLIIGVAVAVLSAMALQVAQRLQHP